MGAVTYFPVNQIVCEDSLEVLKRFPMYSVDLVFTDPPYGIDDENKITFVGGLPLSNKDAWGETMNTPDDMQNFYKLLADLLDNILKEDGSILLFFDRGKPFLLEPFYQKFVFRNIIAFIKRNPSPHLNKNNYRSGFELCAWLSRKKYKINFISQKDMVNVFYGTIGFSMFVGKHTTHPTEKYEWMIKPLIERHSDPGDIILDPFVGSGRICVEAKKLGRRYIGIDINEEYCEMARKWLDETVSIPPPKIKINKWFKGGDENGQL